MEEELKNLFDELENNLPKYYREIVKFTLHRETGAWKGEKPTGEYMDKKMRECFEKPLMKFINDNQL